MSEFIKEETGNFETTDIENNTTMAGLAYLLFFLPLLACPQSKYARFHANQGLLLLLAALAGNLILLIIPFIGWMLMPLYNLAIFAIFIYGMVNGFRGKAIRLPLIGSFNILT